MNAESLFFHILRNTRRTLKKGDNDHYESIKRVVIETVDGSAYEIRIIYAINNDIIYAELFDNNIKNYGLVTIPLPTIKLIATKYINDTEGTTVFRSALPPSVAKIFDE